MSSNLTFVFPGALETRGRKRKYHEDRAATSTETMQVYRAHKRDEKIKKIAVLDFETDPFDPNTEAPVYPFTACILSDDFEHVIWQENLEAFVEELLTYLENLEHSYTIYAHNGGKFDFMFLIHKLRGKVNFKGRAIMAAKIAHHDIRDSTHILPMKLSDWKKDDFDYKKMAADKRGKYRQEIVAYMVNDCRSLLAIVKAFVLEFGFKLTIGQAAMSALKKKYTVAKLGEHTDEEIRRYFYGGRVECLAGAGHFVGAYQLFDVNSMYPWAMAECLHPAGSHYTWRRRGGVTHKTAFLEISCDNYTPGGIGALITRRQNPESHEWETTATVERGTFRTTIHEFETAMDLGLIRNVEIHQYIDCDRFTNFSEFIVPMYERRHETKSLMKAMRHGVKEDDCDPKLLDSPEYLVVKKEDIFLKFLLNNSYGKFAMNPRRFKECYFTDHGETRPEGYEEISAPAYRCPQYDIWERPSPRKNFANVGTAASITGAARAKLLRAIVTAVDPIYCDTDSLICRSIAGVEISDTALGAWKYEAEFEAVAIAGKKMYACLPKGYNAALHSGQPMKAKVRSKGVREGALGWNDILDMLDGEVLNVVASLAPAFKRMPGERLDTTTAEQRYIHRRVRMTAAPRERVA